MCLFVLFGKERKGQRKDSSEKKERMKEGNDHLGARFFHPSKPLGIHPSCCCAVPRRQCVAISPSSGSELIGEYSARSF